MLPQILDFQQSITMYLIYYLSGVRPKNPFKTCASELSPALLILVSVKDLDF